MALSETCSSAGDTAGSPGEGISEMTFLQVGQRLVQEGGYDFLSDFGSDGHSPTERPASPKRERQVLLESSSSDDHDQSALVDEHDDCCPDPPCTDCDSAGAVETQSETEINRLTLSAYSDCGVPFVQTRLPDGFADE